MLCWFEFCVNRIELYDKYTEIISVYFTYVLKKKSEVFAKYNLQKPWFYAFLQIISQLALKIFFRGYDAACY